ncbi:MAG TPA: hypothetical protein VFX30_11250, partial [bacterium]|nr:hypothetical protein [bacterium]
MTLRLLTRVSIFVVLALSWPASGRAGWVSAIAPHHAVFFGSGGGGTVKGRVAFFDSGNCFASSISQYRMSPEACNAFKRRFDPASGAPLTQETSGMRPLTATITVSYAMTPRAAKVGAPPLPGVLCPSRTVQTDRDGFFSVKLDGCFPSVVPLDGFGEPQTAPLPAPDLLKVRVELVYRIADRLRATAIAGEKAMLRLAPLDNSLPATIRALWRKDRILPYYPANFGLPVYTKVETGESEPAEYVLPVYEKTFPLPAGPRGQTVDAGVLAFPDEPRIQPSILEYLKKCLYNWQTLMELHFRAKERFAAEGRPELYDGLLIDKPETNCERCYTLSFTNSLSASLGKNGIMLLNQPTPDIVWEPHGLEYVLGHEFGHGIHFGIAPPFPNWTDSDKVAVFGTAKRPNGEEYWTIHLPQQIHDNRIAF